MALTSRMQNLLVKPEVVRILDDRMDTDRLDTVRTTFEAIRNKNNETVVYDMWANEPI
jgi:hypothetical protein